MQIMSMKQFIYRHEISVYGIFPAHLIDNRKLKTDKNEQKVHVSNTLLNDSDSFQMAYQTS